MFKIKIYIPIVAFLAILVISGCQVKETPTEQMQPLPALANPASVYCQGLGYIEETRESDEGQYGVCTFKDGSECDTWDFLAGRCGQENSYCAKQGYKLEENPESNIATCVFDNGSTCDEYQYFQGECKPGN